MDKNAFTTTSGLSEDKDVAVEAQLLEQQRQQLLIRLSSCFFCGGSKNNGL
jgi:hypothetical protein